MHSNKTATHENKFPEQPRNTSRIKEKNEDTKIIKLPYIKEQTGSANHDQETTSGLFSIPIENSVTSSDHQSSRYPTRTTVYTKYSAI